MSFLFACRHNSKRVQLCEALARGELESAGTTGTTLSGLTSYVERHRPPIVLMENVAGLLCKTSSGRPVDALKVIFGKLGYDLRWAVLNSADYWLPQSRKRIWLWATLAQSTPVDAYDGVMSDLKQMRSSSPFAIQMFLDADQKEIEAAARCRRVSAGSRQQKAKRQLKWPGLHEAYKKKFGIRQKHGEVDDALKSMPRREADVIDVWTEIWQRDGLDPAADEIFADVSQGLPRVPRALGMIPWLCPSAHMWSTVRKRFLTGREKLALQGIHCGKDFPNWSVFSDQVLSDLAGNSFSATVCQAVTFAVLSFRPFCFL